MSFKCDNCEKAQTPGTKPHSVVTARREDGQAKKVMRLCDLCATAVEKGVPLSKMKPAKPALRKLLGKTFEPMVQREALKPQEDRKPSRVLASRNNGKNARRGFAIRPGRK